MNQEIVFYTEFNFTDLYLMCIFEQISIRPDFFSQSILDAQATKYNLYTYSTRTKGLRWHSHFDELERIYSGGIFFKISIVDFLWKIIK